MTIKITERDRQVIDLLREGCGNLEIAERMGVSPRTIKQRLKIMYLKAGLPPGAKRIELLNALYPAAINEHKMAW